MQEPFASLFTQGMVTHQTWQDANGKWLGPEQVEKNGEDWIITETGEAAIAGRVEKMSKSKKNVVDPDEIVNRYGADAVRWFMLSDSPPERDLPWSEAGIEGCWRFVQRLWRVFNSVEAADGQDKALDRKLHQSIDLIAKDIEALAFNKAVARLYELTNAIEKATPSASRNVAVRALARLVAPMVPHLAEEAWEVLEGHGLIADASWPEVDPALLVEDEVTIAVQIKGKLRDTLTVAKGLPNEELERLALASDKVQRSLDGAAIRKVIVVPDRLVNLVV